MKKTKYYQELVDELYEAIRGDKIFFQFRENKNAFIFLKKLIADLTPLEQKILYLRKDGADFRGISEFLEDELIYASEIKVEEIFKDIYRYLIIRLKREFLPDENLKILKDCNEINSKDSLLPVDGEILVGGAFSCLPSHFAKNWNLI